MECKAVEADHIILAGGSFNKQDIFHMRLVLGGDKMNRSPQPPTRILRLYIDDLLRFSHIFSPVGLSNTLLSEGCVLQVAPSRRMVGRRSNGSMH